MVFYYYGANCHHAQKENNSETYNQPDVVDLVVGLVSITCGAVVIHFRKKIGPAHSWPCVDEGLCVNDIQYIQPTYSTCQKSLTRVFYLELISY